MVIFKAYIQLIRPYGPVILGLSVVLGEIVALRAVPSIRSMVLGFFSMFFIAAASFVFNDYQDVEIDRINVPDRPLPKGIVTKSAVLLYGVLLSGMGVFISFFLGQLSFLLSLLIFFLLTWYNLYGKKFGFIGNVAVAFSVALAFPYGAMIPTQKMEISIFMIFLLTFFSNLGREVVKGIADAQGDAKKNVRSIALLYGNKIAALFAAVFFLLTAIIGPTMIWKLIGFRTSLHFLPIILADLGFIHSTYRILNNPTPETARKVAQQVNIWMIMIIVTLFLQYLINLM